MFVGGLGQIQEEGKTVTWMCILPKWMYKEGAPCRRTEEWGMVTVPASPKEEIEQLKIERQKAELKIAVADKLKPFAWVGTYTSYAFFAILAAASIGLYIRLRG